MLVPAVLRRGSHSPLPGGEFFPRGSEQDYFPPSPDRLREEGLSARGCGRGFEDGSSEWISRGGRFLLRCTAKHESTFIPQEETGSHTLPLDLTVLAD